MTSKRGLVLTPLASPLVALFLGLLSASFAHISLWRVYPVLLFAAFLPMAFWESRHFGVVISRRRWLALLALAAAAAIYVCVIGIS